MTGHFTSYETRTDHELATRRHANVETGKDNSYAPFNRQG
jgi:hypothetical protein